MKQKIKIEESYSKCSKEQLKQLFIVILKERKKERKKIESI